MMLALATCAHGARTTMPDVGAHFSHLRSKAPTPLSAKRSMARGPRGQKQTIH